jgi:hypothetical protein
MLAWPLVYLTHFAAGQPKTGSAVVFMVWLFLPTWVLMAGVFLLAQPEGYAPADTKDRRWRVLLRIAAAAPATAVGLFEMHLGLRFSTPTVAVPEGLAEKFGWASFIFATIGSVPLILLLSLRLRSLARRARSAYLAEDCLIAGIGTSAALVYIAGLIPVLINAQKFGLDPNWGVRSKGAILLPLIAIVAAIVAAIIFGLWSAHLLIRFAIAFHIAARKLRRGWAGDDRAQTETPEKL